MSQQRPYADRPRRARDGGGRPGHQRRNGKFRQPKPGIPHKLADVGGRHHRLQINDDTPFADAFADLGVPRKLAHGLGALGILEPFPIQAATIGDAIAGLDVLGRGRTGSGKTLAFGLPLMARLMDGKTTPRHPRGLILTPTRELAMQVNDALAPLAQLVGLHLVIVIGGAKYERQIDSLARGADIVVATPGRLEDLIKREACVLDRVEIAVLDEADQMADMGFLPIVDQLMSMVPRGGQRLLFSATLDRDVEKIVKKHLDSPVEHATEPEGETVTTMDHHVFVVEPREKYPLIRTIATRSGRCIAFVKTQRAADEICDELNALGVKADALHGGKSQGARNRALQNLKDGSVSVLVATDVAARGIHVDGIDLVLNVDMPRDFKDYLHRAGRTARAGAHGVVVSVTSVKQSRFAKDLMAKAGVDAEFHRVTADADVVAALTGAKRVEAERPGRGSRTDREPRREFTDREPRRESRERTEREPRHERAERPRREFTEREPRRENRERTERPRTERSERPRTERTERAPRGERREFPKRSEREPRRERSAEPRRENRERTEREPRAEFTEREPRRKRAASPTAKPNRAERRAHLQPKPGPKPKSKAGKSRTSANGKAASAPKSRRGKPRPKHKRAFS